MVWLSWAHHQALHSTHAPFCMSLPGGRGLHCTALGARVLEGTCSVGMRTHSPHWHQTLAGCWEHASTELSPWIRTYRVFPAKRTAVLLHWVSGSKSRATLLSWAGQSSLSYRIFLIIYGSEVSLNSLFLFLSRFVLLKTMWNFIFFSLLLFSLGVRGTQEAFILNLFPACDEIREAGPGLGQAETESIRINGRCSDRGTHTGEQILIWCQTVQTSKRFVSGGIS